MFAVSLTDESSLGMVSITIALDAIIIIKGRYFEIQKLQNQSLPLLVQPQEPFNKRFPS